MKRSAAEVALAAALRNGWLSSRDVGAGTVRVVDHSARTACVEVDTNRGGGLVIKFGLDRVGRAAVWKEGTLIAWAGAGAGGRRLRPALPRLIDFNRRSAWLVLERVGGGALDARLARGGYVSRATLHDAGRALAALHRRTPPRFPRHSRDSRTPWPFGVAEPPPPEFLSRATPASIELITVLERLPELRTAIDAAAQAWSPGSQVHGDLRWENCLLRGGRPRDRITFIDWERSGVGDPAWDLGAFFGEALRVSLFESRVRSGTPPRVHPAGRVPNAARAAPGPFWEGYRSIGSPPNPERDSVLLQRSLRFAGVWLVGRVFELAHAVPELDAPCRNALHLAANVLARPRDAARDLLGIPTPRSGR